MKKTDFQIRNTDKKLSIKTKPQASRKDTLSDNDPGTSNYLPSNPTLRSTLSFISWITTHEQPSKNSRDNEYLEKTEATDVSEKFTFRKLTKNKRLLLQVLVGVMSIVVTGMLIGAVFKKSWITATPQDAISRTVGKYKVIEWTWGIIKTCTRFTPTVSRNSSLVAFWTCDDNILLFQSYSGDNQREYSYKLYNLLRFNNFLAFFTILLSVFPPILLIKGYRTDREVFRVASLLTSVMLCFHVWLCISLFHKCVEMSSYARPGSRMKHAKITWNTPYKLMHASLYLALFCTFLITLLLVLKAHFKWTRHIKFMMGEDKNSNISKRS